MVGPTLRGVQSPVPQPEARADVLDPWKPGTQASLACGRGISGPGLLPGLTAPVAVQVQPGSRPGV